MGISISKLASLSNFKDPVKNPTKVNGIEFEKLSENEIITLVTNNVIPVHNQTLIDHANIKNMNSLIYLLSTKQKIKNPYKNTEFITEPEFELNLDSELDDLEKYMNTT